MADQPVRIVVMEGDGIGPEITAATLAVLREADRAFGLGLSFTSSVVGFAALQHVRHHVPGGRRGGGAFGRWRDPGAGIAQ